ncbi:MAG: GNAT family N-acetyltransferase [Proteobacteria bacterium]|nr:GNAT family N-acetyltransferase [Pseudomonadota bacterium]
MEVKIASSEAELRKISPVLLQLRSQYDEDSLLAQIRLQQAEGYQIAYVEKDGEVLCVAGFVMCNKLAWQKHIYVDDLVTDAAVRSTGAGKFMMDWLKNHAREHGCKQLHLDSGVQRFAAHKFYLREGFELNSHHFGIPDLSAH